MAARPEVTLDNQDAVYDFYAVHRQNVPLARAAYALLGRRFRPRVAYAPGAAAGIRAALQVHRPFVVAVNHLTENDPYVLAAAAWRSALRPIVGRTRVLAKDELFREPALRRRIDLMGGIPVFRGKNHGMRAVADAGRRMMDVGAERVAAGDSLAIFPEGTCNLGDPAVLTDINSGIGHIAMRAAKRGATPVLLSIGLSYGPESAYGRPREAVREASVFLGAPLFEFGARPAEITRTVAADLQAAVDGAAARW
ncbi:lysophospholipid acyltransferase family protein [Rhodococcus sp. HNM0569]|uniref:lysophospholipid acyltransferase family protein n=1 Tax=Rhodococcus sp. HNM0569 TaxID=2716340 RepID=UPI00146E33D7|nr:lysophospholipid acyltransferase family protein [Rhodococcus sp. HNM0569]NLU84141.1 1-acyl-sn-glycerol-3-phosphate acyltransferase [Rhodococcus sp. HNM0569]